MGSEDADRLQEVRASAPSAIVRYASEVGLGTTVVERRASIIVSALSGLVSPWMVWSIASGSLTVVSAIDHVQAHE